MRLLAHTCIQWLTCNEVAGAGLHPLAHSVRDLQRWEARPCLCLQGLAVHLPGLNLCLGPRHAPEELGLRRGLEERGEEEGAPLRGRCNVQEELAGMTHRHLAGAHGQEGASRAF